MSEYVKRPTLAELRQERAALWNELKTSLARAGFHLTEETKGQLPSISTLYREDIDAIERIKMLDWLLGKEEPSE